MKIFEQTPNYLVRIQITRVGDKTEHITFCDTTMKEVEGMCRKVIDSQKLSVFIEGKKTSINIRESLGGSNMKSKTVSFKGLSPKNTHELIIKNLTNTK